MKIACMPRKLFCPFLVRAAAALDKKLFAARTQIAQLPTLSPAPAATLPLLLHFSLLVIGAALETKDQVKLELRLSLTFYLQLAVAVVVLFQSLILFLMCVLLFSSCLRIGGISARRQAKPA